MPKYKDLIIKEIKAIPISFPIEIENRVRLGIGNSIKNDAVIVKVVTQGGLTGWGEAHHGRCPGAIAHLINTTIKMLVEGKNANDINDIWNIIYRNQLASHGMGTGACLALSGLDLALWDIKGKYLGLPLYKLLGGSRKSIPAYAGGVALGYQPTERLIEEARPLIEQGYKALKLRVGDNTTDDINRTTGIRKEFGESITLLTDANTGYSLNDVRTIMPFLDELNVGWLEEPFPAHDYRGYYEARKLGRTALAAGENHYTRFEFNRLIEEKNITILQPDLSKSGGLTEVIRIANLASSWRLPIHPHSSKTALNMAASIHLLSAIDNSGYFEADVSKNNLFRDHLTDEKPYNVDENGFVRAIEKPGIGLNVDEVFLKNHPVIEGSSYI